MRQYDASATHRRAGCDHRVDHAFGAVVHCFVGCEPTVAVAVGPNLFGRYTAVHRGQFGHQIARNRELLGLDRDVGCVALHLPERLVHEDPTVRVCRPLARRAADQQELRHRRREAHAHGADIARQRLHRVVDREPGVDLTTRRVKVERDVVVTIGFQHEQLRAHSFGEGTVDRTGEHDPALLEQLAGNTVFKAGDLGLLQLHGCTS